jgi:multiple sugar transport system ATP-binding protein
MGRAIVREPVAFLMDEPLSNLDAKLRVQMRAEISRIQNDFATTTIYVTHDQVEAMTMGDRVAVIKKGRLQQVDTPQALYDEPVNLFVGGFIGSPSMNMVAAKVEGDAQDLSVSFGDIQLRLPVEVTSRRPNLVAYAGGTVIVGIRPEDIEAAEIETDAPRDRSFRTSVELREALGSEILVHFRVPEPPVLTEDTRELARDLGLREGDERSASAHSTFVARLDPRAHAREGESIELVIDASRLHFFDPETGLAVDGGGTHGATP